MENRNIYKSDDILIVISWLMLIPAVYFAWPLVREIPSMETFRNFVDQAPLLLERRLYWVFADLAGAVVCQVIGRVIRRKETESQSIIDYMLYSRESSLSMVAASVGLSESRVKKLVCQLEHIPAVGITIKGEKLFLGQPEWVFSPVQGVTEAPEAKNEEIQSIMQNRGIGKLEKFTRIQQQTEGFSSLEEFARNKNPDEDVHESAAPNSSCISAAGSSPECKNAKGKRGLFFVILILLFLTPLWPLAVFLLIRNINKTKRALVQKKGEDLASPLNQG